MPPPASVADKRRFQQMRTGIFDRRIPVSVFDAMVLDLIRYRGRILTDQFPDRFEGHLLLQTVFYHLPVFECEVFVLLRFVRLYHENAAFGF